MFLIVDSNFTKKVDVACQLFKQKGVCLFFFLSAISYDKKLRYLPQSHR